MDELERVNERLRAGRVGVGLCLRGQKLYLQATLPPKPGSGKPDWYQQKIALDVYANLAGLRRAEAEAKKLGAQLSLKEFAWKNYQPEQTEQRLTVGAWIERFEQDYWIRRAKTPAKETTWRVEYEEVFRKLDAGAKLTADYFLSVVAQTPPDTRTRVRYCMVLGQLAKFAHLTVDLKALRGSYGPSRVSPRDLPDDQLIQDCWAKINNPSWAWLYGVMATWGLRPHECFQIEQMEGYILEVGEATKTGRRRVWACYPEWVDLWKLTEKILPECKGTNRELGHRVGRQFQRYNIPFPPYALRHCWAIRTMEFGLDLSLAAQQMGHSVQVHTDLYHHWISDRHHQRAFDLLMNRPGRPRPPSHNDPLVQAEQSKT